MGDDELILTLNGCGPFHVQDALPLGEEPLVPTEQEAVLTPQLLCACWRTEKCPSQGLNHNSLLSNLVSGIPSAKTSW